MVFSKKLLLAGLLSLICFDAFGGTSTVRRLDFNVAPSNELDNVAETTKFSWTCYDFSSGRLEVCQLKYWYEGLAVVPAITQACVPDASGMIPRDTCGNGGHIDATHIGPRPTTYKSSPIRYALANPSTQTATFVEGPSPTTRPLDRVELDVSESGGIYRWRAEFRTGSREQFASSDTFPDGHLEAEGFVNVSVRNLVQMPSPSATDEYIFANGGNATHPNAAAIFADSFTIEVLPTIAKVYTFYNLNARKLSVNDISLPKGGLFDVISADWDTIPGHMTHREGLDVDINTPVTLPCVNDRELRLAVDSLLKPMPTRSALYCEPPNGEAAHIDFTELVE